MIEQFKAVWYRNPSEQELVILIDGAVREEVLVREALALGLDRRDAAIRNRLKQEMLFLTDSTAQMLEPDDDVLRTFMAANPDDFTRPQMIAFEQVYLGDNASQTQADSALGALAGGAEPQSVGRRGILPPSLPPSTGRQINATFGARMFDALKVLATGE